ncbi:MAG: signal peptidase I, partial [Mycoplasmatales bacterium]
VSGESMTPTYQDRERVFVLKKGYELNKGDVISFWADRSEPTDDAGLIARLYLHQPDLENKELHIKRIVGVPGDKIEIKKEPDYDENVVVTNVYVNGEKEVSSTMIPQIQAASYTLAENEYFVIGDNYNNSLDSRIHGPVKKEDIFGKIINGKERA